MKKIRIEPPSDSRPVQHYNLRHRVEAWVSRNVFHHVTYTVRRGMLKGLRRKGGLGWIPDQIIAEAVTPEQRLWARLGLAGKVVYDIGSFEGLAAMFFARTARQVICFEPNPSSFQRLQENMKLNGFDHVNAYPIGIGAVSQELELLSSWLMPGGASTDRRLAEQIKTNGGKLVRERIQVEPLDVAIRDLGLAPPDFIKIDVEGVEADVLRGATQTLQQYRPPLYLEMHGETRQEKKAKVAEIVALLHANGYDFIQHVESDRLVDCDNSEVAAEGHLYAVVSSGSC